MTINIRSKLICGIAVVGLAFLAACSSQPSPESPSGVVRQYVEATQKKDIPAMKRLLSKGSLEVIEKSAKDQGVTADDLLRREAEGPAQKLPETRNEKIEGDNATVEIRNETTGEYDMKLPFVREDGAWKIARDKYIDELMKRYAEERRGPAANSGTNTANSNH